MPSVVSTKDGVQKRQFLGRSRVQLACRLLQQNDQPIGEIALDLACCDRSAFTAQFRCRMGFTPHRYRKQFGKRLG